MAGPDVKAAKAIQIRARKKKRLKSEDVAGFSLWEIVSERAMSAPGTAGEDQQRRVLLTLRE